MPATSTPRTSTSFHADQDLDNVFELFSARFDGTTPPVKLHPSLSPGRAIGLFEPAPDGVHVLFSADLARPSAFELYRARLDGSGIPRRLGMELETGQDVASITCGAGGRVTFLAETESLDLPQLYSVPLDGTSPPQRLHQRLATGGQVQDLALSGDGQRVVYRAHLRSNDVLELFSVPIAGGSPPRRLNSPRRESDADYDVAAFQFSPDGQDVLYTRFFGAVDELRVPIDGHRPAQRISSHNPDEYLAALSPDGAYYLFIRPSGEVYSRDLLSVRSDGTGSPVLLDRAIPSLAYESFFFSVAVSPDSRRAIFCTNQEDQDQPHLYTAPLDGSSPAVRLDPGFDVPSYGVEFTADGSRVVFLSRASGTSGLQLYSAPSDGNAPAVQLNANLPPGGTVGGFTPEYEFQRELFRITPDGTTVVYVAEQDTNDQTELYRVAIDGLSPPVKLNGPLPPQGDLRIGSYAGAAFHLTPDGANVLYVADAEVDQTFELYRVSLAGGAATKLSGTVQPGTLLGGNPDNFYFLRSGKELSPDGQWYVYTADADHIGVNELYSVRVDGSAPPVRLKALPVDRDVYDFRISPDSSRVVFRTSGSFFLEVHSAPIDGSAPAVLLADRAEFWDLNVGYDITPDSSRVLVAARLDDENRSELYACALDGSTPRVKLSGPMVSGGDVDSYSGAQFKIAPDGSRVVYFADQDRDDVIELYVSFLGPPPKAVRPPSSPR